MTQKYKISKKYTLKKRKCIENVHQITGKEQVFIFFIEISAKWSAKRNYFKNGDQLRDAERWVHTEILTICSQ